MVRKEYARSTWLSHSSSLERARSEVVTWCCCALLQPTLQLAKFSFQNRPPRDLSYINRAPHLLSLIGVIGTIPQTKINRPDRKQRGGDRMEVTKKFAKFANFGTDLRFVESRQLIPKVTPNFWFKEMFAKSELDSPR